MTVIEKINLNMVHGLLSSKKQLSTKEEIFLCEMLSNSCKGITQKQRDWIQDMFRRIPITDTVKLKEQKEKEKLTKKYEAF